MKKFFRKNIGFSLIEIFIIFVIMSILIGLAFPIYSDYFLKTNRMEATQTLLTVAVAMEKYYLEFDTYENATLNNLHFSNFIARNSYALHLNVVNALEYELTAIPLAKQKQDTACAILTLKSTGEKLISGNGNISECW